MKRLIIGAFAYIMLCLGICTALLAVLNLIAIHAPKDPFYVLGGGAVIFFVVSWLMLKISRQQ